MQTKEYRDAHKKEIKILQSEYYKKHKDVAVLYRREYYQANREMVLKRQKEYRKKNKEKISLYLIKNRKRLSYKANIYQIARRKVDIQFKMRQSLRVRLCRALNGHFKSGSAVKDLGCTIDELKFYLEGQFKDGMTWENWTTDGWHIDHKIPLSFFDLTNKEQFLKACHYTNLQPMWAKENLSKGAKMTIKSEKTEI